MFKQFGALVILITLLVACGGSTKITKSFVDPELRKLDLEGVLVVGIARSQPARQEFEHAFAKALARNGVRARTSYDLLPNIEPSADAIVAAAKAHDLDAIMITRYTGETREEVFHPGRIYYGIAPAYGAGYYGGFDGYYGYAYEIAREQPVWSANVTHAMVSDLYVTESREHLWQAVSETIESSNSARLLNDAVNALIDNLKEKGLLP